MKAALFTFAFALVSVTVGFQSASPAQAQDMIQYCSRGNCRAPVKAPARDVTLHCNKYVCRAS